MKILIPLALLLQLGTVHASLIGVMDSGSDMTHKDLASKIWVNLNEQIGDVDLDGDGLPGDVNGWDFTANKAQTFDPQYNYLIDNDVKTFFLLYSKYETKTINVEEFDWLKTHMNDDVLMKKVDFIGSYIHGTHVSGISALNNPNAKIIAFKVIPTVYEPVAPAPAPSAAVSIVDAIIDASLTPAPAPTPTISIEDFKKELSDSIGPQVDELAALHALMNFHNVDVVNESFGIGYNDAAGFIKKSFIEELKRDPTDAELLELVTLYMSQLVAAGPRVFQAAPNTLFAIAAGNDTFDNDKYPDYPAGIEAENKIVVAATLGYKSIAEFSNYGVTRVDVAAPGVAITSTAPTNSYIPLSGTSQATPFVTNTIAQIKDINPGIALLDVKAIVMGTVDIKSWLADKVKSSGIVNKERAKRAALYSKTMNITQAIAKARAEVGDVLINKSFDNISFGKLKGFRPVRPVLHMKRLK